MGDINDLERSIKRMEKFPTKYLTAAVKKGAIPILMMTRALAPRDKGNLVGALTMKQEKAKPGKRVFDVTYSGEANDKLAKTSLTGKRSYYPSSQEYGWKLKNGTKKAGLHFMKKAADANESGFYQTVIDEMMIKIEREWRT